jgi:hypothetical protein
MLELDRHRDELKVS